MCSVILWCLGAVQKGIMQMIVNKCIVKRTNWTETAKLFQSHKEKSGLKMLLKISAFQRGAGAEASKGFPRIT